MSLLPQKTYLGGQDLLAIAVKNRKEYHMDQLPCTNLKRELEKVWKAISDGISEREKRLEMAKEFHHISEDILLEVDRMTQPTSPVVAMVGDSSHQGDDLKQRIKHAIGTPMAAICTYIHMHTYTCIRTHAYVHIHKYVHMHTYTCICTHTYIRTHAYIHMHTYTCIRTHAYIHMHTYTCIRTYTCIHTHAYIHMHTYTCIRTHAYVHMHSYTCILVCR